MRKIFYWKLRNSELQLGERTLIVGILNVTPDSFADGGMFRDPERAYARAIELEEEGADVIDLGGESTRPGSARISADEEWQRLVPVLKRLRGNLRVPLSLDTYKSEVAERALDYGIEIINDPSGLTFDPNLAKTAASGNLGLILNHMRGTPETWARLAPLPDAPASVTRELEATVSRARRAGVEQNRIAIDPGIGFGKRGEQNVEIIAHLGELARLELPILVGPSRKSFLRQKTEDETLFATAAAVTAAILKGAHMVRVHDVKELKACVAVADEIARASAVPRVPVERPVQRGSQQRLIARTSEREAALTGEGARPPRPPVIAPAARTETKPSEPVRERRVEERRDGGERKARFGGPVAPRTADGARRKDARPGERPPRFPRRDDRPQGERPRGARPPDARPRDQKPREDRPREGPARGDRFPDNRGRTDGARGERPRQDGDRQGGPPRDRFDNRGDNRPDQPSRAPRGEQPRGEQPRGGRPAKRVFRKRP